MTSEEPINEKRTSMSKPIERVASQSQGSIVAVDAHGHLVTNNVIVDEAIEAIGFGRFQWQLTFSCGFGFLVDQMLLVSISLVTPQAAMEFGPKYPTLLSASNYAGLLVGAVVLGGLADNIGRRLVWQASIFGISIFTMVAASSPSWPALNVFLAICGVFGGGNLAIDLTILAESIPRRWSFVLPGLAGIWGVGNVFTGLIAWPLLVNFGCPSGSTPDNCSRRDNMGWRYLYIVLGGLCLIMSLIRSFVLRSQESPRWLISCGRIPEAVGVLNTISSTNGSDYTVSVDQFIPVPEQTKKDTLSVRENIRRASKLFSGRQQFRLMACLVMMWMLIGIAYPLYTVFLPYYLTAHGANLGDGSAYSAYRDWTVSSAVGVIGPFVAMYMVSLKWFRSKRSLFIMACVCTAFSGAFTTVRTAGENLAFSSMINFSLNGLYAVIYSYTPQALNVEYRGLGTGLLMALGRVSSLSAPFIATFSDVTSSAPIWVSCGCYVVISLISLALPIDTAAFN